MLSKRFYLMLAVGLLAVQTVAAQSFEKVPDAKQAAPSQPAAAVTGKIAVINLQVAILGTQEGQKGVQELQEKFRPQEQQLEKLRQEVDGLQKQLQDGQRTLSREAQQDLSRQAAVKQRQGRRLEEDLQEDVQLAQNDFLSIMSQKMQAVIGQYAQQNGIVLVMNVIQGTPLYLYAGAGVDITQDIIRVYDLSHPVQAAVQPGASK